MKRAGRNIILISLFLVFALLNVAVFFTVNDARFDTAVFWLAWAFAFPVNFAVFVLIHLWCGKKGGDALVQMPIAYHYAFGFGAVYLVVGAIFMYCPINAIGIPIAVEAVVTVAYLIVAMYAVFGANHIMNSEREFKAKVLYISMLKADIDDIIARATDGSVRNALCALTEDVRFSDPMSHPSLGGVEAQISAAVGRISTLVSEGNNDGALQAIGEVKQLLEARNRRCLMLK